MSIQPAEEKRQVGVYQEYLENSSQPLTCFFFALPFFLIYHGGLWWLSSFSGLKWANAADIAIADALGRLGMAGPLISFIVVVIVFLAKQNFAARPWRMVPLATWPLMILESSVFALPLFMLSRLVTHVIDSVNLWSLVLNGNEAGSFPSQAGLILSCGAGVYEEFLFRLILMGSMLFVLDKVFGVTGGWKYVLAAVTQAVLFALSHHLPGSPEELTSFADFRLLLPAFSFRVVAGVYFAFLYIERGFGIAAGSHAIYDLFLVAMDNVLLDFGD
ncbi:MAG: CPBP family intramembrane metalloprotease [Planctomycetota bacterium]|jgi:hypothetical protein|nr:CPBP family intramembrane metalloprotease [Planctomycetota bacterium]